MDIYMTVTSDAFTPKIELADNFKDFFIRNDALKHISTELTITLLRKYKCEAGCQMCYIQDLWIPNETYDKKYSPGDITPDIEEQLLSLFDSFYNVTSLDDLYMLKHKYPQLYQFYVNHSHRIKLTSMSDNAFFRQYPLIMNELHFAAIYEISFSDVLLSKKTGKIVTDIIQKLTLLHLRSPIQKIKVIILKENGESASPVIQLINWAHDNGIKVAAHSDFRRDGQTQLTLNHADHQESNLYTQDNLPLMVLSEAVYLAYTDMYLTCADSTIEGDLPFYHIEKNDMPMLLSTSLQHKVNKYTQYASNIKDRHNNKLYDYYEYVSRNVRVHHDFNFIPTVVLPPWMRIHDALKNYGFKQTQLGLYRPNATNTVIPLFSFRETPQPKIAIPIKVENV